MPSKVITIRVAPNNNESNGRVADATVLEATLEERIHVGTNRSDAVLKRVNGPTLRSVKKKKEGVTTVPEHDKTCAPAGGDEHDKTCAPAGGDEHDKACAPAGEDASVAAPFPPLVCDDGERESLWSEEACDGSCTMGTLHDDKTPSTTQLDTTTATDAEVASLIVEDASDREEEEENAQRLTTVNPCQPLAPATINEFQRVAFHPVTAKGNKRLYTFTEQDEKHLNQQISYKGITVNPIVFGHLDFGKTYKYFQLPTPHPYPDVRYAYVSRYCQREGQWGILTLEGVFVPVHGVLAYPVEQPIPPGQPCCCQYVSLFHANFARIACWNVDLPCIVYYYLTQYAPDVTVYRLRYVPFRKRGVMGPRDPGVALGQVEVVTSSKVDIEELFSKHPCFFEHQGIVVREEYTGEGVIVRQHSKKRGSVDKKYPPEIASIILAGRTGRTQV